MDGEYYRPTYKVPTYRPPTTYKKTYAPQYREEPYDNSGAMRAAEQARLIREAQQRQAAQLAAQRQAEAVAFAQKQAAIAKAQQSRISLGGGTYLNPEDMWNNYKAAQAKGQANFGNNWQTLQPAYQNAISPMGSALGNAWNNISQGLVNANLAVTNPLRQAFGFPVTESWQRPGAQTGTTYFPGYQGGYPGARANFPNYNVNVAPGAAEDWGMMQSGAIANRFGGGQLDRANWGRGVPTWEEVLRYADPNAHDPYDVAGNPYFTAQDMPIEDYYGDGYGGYGGGGSYSSKPGYYGQSSNYGNRYYENLLQWNI